MENLKRRYFGCVLADVLKAKLEKNRLPYFLSDDDIAIVAIITVNTYGAWFVLNAISQLANL
ncbi:MAG: hypothetical protein K2L34_00380 [Muribaculaceae bacterium]|nr:hypothetical protein [Muribaculaceae bacterium]